MWFLKKEKETKVSPHWYAWGSIWYRQLFNCDFFLSYNKVGSSWQSKLASIITYVHIPTTVNHLKVLWEMHEQMLHMLAEAILRKQRYSAKPCKMHFKKHHLWARGLASQYKKGVHMKGFHWNNVRCVSIHGNYDLSNRMLIPITWLDSTFQMCLVIS